MIASRSPGRAVVVKKRRGASALSACTRGCEDEITATARDLARVTELNEKIKAVVSISHGLQLDAINARLVARRAGHRVRGYAVVSTELRSFSRHLGYQMGELMGNVGTLVGGIADVLRIVRQRRHLQAAGRSKLPPGLVDALHRNEVALRQGFEANTFGWRRADQELRHSLKLCETGRVLARGAKIEAVYGGERSDELIQTSQAIEATIELIRDRLVAGRTLVKG